MGREGHTPGVSETPGATAGTRGMPGTSEAPGRTARPGAHGQEAPGGLSAFVLKAIAILGMTANHTGYLFFDHLPLGVLAPLFALGGLTFPIMAFLLVEGYRHTSNVKRYAGRLLVFALVSQIPYGLFLSFQGNVLFTLLIGLGILYASDRMENRASFWALAFAGTLVSFACDWGLIGVIMVVLFKELGAGVQPGMRPAVHPGAPVPAESRPRDRALPAAFYTPLGAVALPVLLVVVADGIPGLGALIADVALGQGWTGLPFVLFSLVGCTLSIPFLRAYRGRRGLPMKWFFYAYYPLHLLVLGLLYVALFGTMPASL